MFPSLGRWGESCSEAMPLAWVDGPGHEGTHGPSARRRSECHTACRVTAALAVGTAGTTTTRCPTGTGAGRSRLHGTAEDRPRKLNRTENVPPIAPTDPDFGRLYASGAGRGGADDVAPDSHPFHGPISCFPRGGTGTACRTRARRFRPAPRTTGWRTYSPPRRTHRSSSIPMRLAQGSHPGLHTNRLAEIGSADDEERVDIDPRLPSRSVVADSHGVGAGLLRRVHDDGSLGRGRIRVDRDQRSTVNGDVGRTSIASHRRDPGHLLARVGEVGCFAGGRGELHRPSVGTCQRFPP